MIKASLAILLFSLFGSSAVLAQSSVFRSTEVVKPMDQHRSSAKADIMDSHVITEGTTNIVPKEVLDRFGPDQIAKLPPPIWKALVDQHVDFPVLENMDRLAPDESEVEECPPLGFAIEFSQAECISHKADQCSWGENDCDHGFQENDVVVTDSAFGLVWKTRNGILVADNCHGYSQMVPSNGLGEFNAGAVNWKWDGPLPGRSAPAGYSASQDLPDEDLFAFVPESFGLIGEAIAGGTSVVYGRKGGRFDCKALVLGKCWQYKEIPYSYSCTLDGADASPR